MACSISQSNCDAKWLPSVAIAGSVLLKQRDSKMNATASIIGVLFEDKVNGEMFVSFTFHTKYSKEMSQKSHKVPLGVIFKNENLNEDMLSILKVFHTYLPRTPDGGVDGQNFCRGPTYYRKGNKCHCLCSKWSHTRRSLRRHQPSTGRLACCIKTSY
ncbi:hypothetical protein QZH41_012148, partial [Actinostola sp. cb2023]